MKKLFETPSVKVVRFSRNVVMGESTVTNEETVEQAVNGVLNAADPSTQNVIAITKVTVVL